MRRTVIGLLTMLVVLGFAAGTATATTTAIATGTNTNDPDSGTCGNTWANDSFTRSFYPISSTGTGTFVVKERFTLGHFVTLQGTSPGACNNGTAPNGNTISAGIKGHFNGYEYLHISNGTFNPNGSCTPDAGNTGCDSTSKFVAAFYGTSASYDVGTYKFTYKSKNATLCRNFEIQQSADLGPYSGDIANFCV